MDISKNLNKTCASLRASFCEVKQSTHFQQIASEQSTLLAMTNKVIRDAILY